MIDTGLSQSTSSPWRISASPCSTKNVTSASAAGRTRRASRSHNEWAAAMPRLNTQAPIARPVSGVRVHGHHPDARSGATNNAPPIAMNTSACTPTMTMRGVGSGRSRGGSTPGWRTCTTARTTIRTGTTT